MAGGLTFSVTMDPDELGQLTSYFDGMIDRAKDRGAISSILQTAISPLSASEQDTLSSHKKSGALSASLVARTGGGDRAGTVSAFIAPTASHATLQATWGKHGRKQQQKWAAGLSRKGGRARVFYATMVHQGHIVITHGHVATTGKAHTDPIPFARMAADALGEDQSDAAANAILAYIVGE